MRLIFALVGCSVALALIGAGVAYVFAPDPAQRFLKMLASSLGMVAVSTLIIANLLHSLQPLVLLLTLAAISLFAHLIRTRRQRRPERPQRLRGVERTPVMPRHVPKDEL